MNNCAGIVTYNPELLRLRKNLNAIVKQVDKIIIFDNASQNASEVSELLLDYPEVTLVKSEQNMGIAAAFNYIVNYCLHRKVEWVLLLDQDSVCPSDMILQYSRHSNKSDIAVLSPLVIDKRRALRDMGVIGEIQEIKNCVSSGSYINVPLCKKLGLFEGNLFIDVVDYEYCMRARLQGYKVMRVNSLILDQEFGTVVKSRYADILNKIGNKTKINMFYHLAYTPVYSPLRVFYTIRNWVYCIRKYKEYSDFKTEVFKLLRECILFMIRGKLNHRIMASVIKGMKAGLCMELVPVNKTSGKHKIELM